MRPTEEGVGLDVHRGVTPRGQPAKDYHNQPSGIIGAVWLHLPFVEQGKLFAQGEVLGCQCAARPGTEDEEVDEIARSLGYLRADFRALSKTLTEGSASLFMSGVTILVLGNDR